MKACGGLFVRLASIGLLAAFFITTTSHAAFAQVAPSLGTAQSFSVLGGSAVTNTGPTVVTGNLGVSPGTSVTGFPPGTVIGGAIHAADAVALQAQSDTTTAYNDLAGQACNTTFGVPTDLGGLTLVPGVYCFASSAQLTGTLTLDGGGDPNAVWVFKVGSTLTTASSSTVLLINSAQQCNDFWQVGSSATLGTSSAFVGNILALTSISLTTNATISGRVLARNGAVTMDSNTISAAACVAPPVTPIPPTLGKAFSPGTINAGDVSTLTITLNNGDATAASLTAPLVDTLPTGVVIASTPVSSTTCGGTLTAASGSSTVTLTGGSIPANSSCTIVVPVTAANGGTFINSLAAGSLQTSNGNNAAPAAATLVVNAPTAVAPTLGKAFSPATINAGGTSTLTITLSNAAAIADAMTAPLTDTLPTGVLIAGVASTTCGGTIAATTGGSTVTLTGGSIPANGSCTITVLVTAANAGNFVNTLPAGALQTNNGNNAAPAVATLNVNAPSTVAPTLHKTFSPATITAGGTSTLTITLSNAGTTADTLTAPFTDTLPNGVLIAGAASNTCGGTVTAATGGSTVTLTGGSIPANGSCMITVLVTAANAGNFVNTLPAGALQTNNGNNAAPAAATLTVTAGPNNIPPTLSKSFSPSTIVMNGISTLTITLHNPNSTVAHITAPLTDVLPADIIVSGSASTTCGGTVAAVKGGSTVTLTGGSIPANGSCTVTVPVTTTVCLGPHVNTLPVGALHTDKGNNTVAAVATLTITTAPGPTTPGLFKYFDPAFVQPNGTSTLNIFLINRTSTVETLTAPLVDNFPAGVVVAGGASNTCGGVFTAVKGSSKVTLTGGAIPANSTCKLMVNVTATGIGQHVNTLPVGTLHTNHGNNTVSTVAIITVSTSAGAPPKLIKSFSPATILSGGVSTLTITLNNPNSTVATLTAPFIDTFPADILVSGAASTTCGGTVTAVPGSSKVTLTGGAIPANGSCKVIVRVVATATCKGQRINTLHVGTLQTNKGSNTAPASATITVN
jgi:uncharacterized repeat protein (TIGR01451 family)